MNKKINLTELRKIISEVLSENYKENDQELLDTYFNLVKNKLKKKGIPYREQAPNIIVYKTNEFITDDKNKGFIISFSIFEKENVKKVKMSINDEMFFFNIDNLFNQIENMRKKI